MKSLKKNNVLIMVLLAITVLMSVGFAVLSTTLNINGTAKVKSQTWDIHFENVQVQDGSVSIGTNDSAATINPNDNTEVTYTVSLNKPGDYYEFLVDVKNFGTIDGMIDTITSTLQINEETPITIADDKSNLPVYLDYSVTYSDNLKIAQNHELKAGEKETYKVKIEFKRDIANSDLPTDNQTLRFSMRPTFVQSNENATSVPHAPVLTTKYTVTSTEMTLGLTVPDGINLRNTPELVFELDESLEYGARIDSILNEIKNKENK